MRKKITFFLILSCLTLIIAGCMSVTNPATQEQDVILISDSEETRIGRQVALEVEKKYLISQNPTLNKRVKNIGQKLANISERKNLTFQFKVLEREDINAFALPGGFIYVNRGLLAMLDDDSELAGVLGHEIAHVTCRHGVKRLQNQMGYSLFLSILFENSKTIRQVVTLAYNLISLGYSKEDEFQADQLSVIYTYKAGYNPEGIMKFMEKLKQIQKREPSEVETFLSTHPPASERIKRIKEEIAKLKNNTDKTRD